MIVGYNCRKCDQLNVSLVIQTKPLHTGGSYGTPSSVKQALLLTKMPISVISRDCYYPEEVGHALTAT